jgi:hypothetical protein
MPLPSSPKPASRLLPRDINHPWTPGSNKHQAMCSSRSMSTEIASLISTPSTPMGEARATAAALATNQATSPFPSRPQPTQPTNTDLATLPMGLPPVGTPTTDASAPEARAVDAATDNTTSYPSSNPREHLLTGEMTIATTNDQPKPDLTTSPMVLPPMASAVGAVARGAATTLDTWLLTTSPDAPAFYSTYETTTSFVVGMSTALMSALCCPLPWCVASPHPAWGWSHLLPAVVNDPVHLDGGGREARQWDPGLLAGEFYHWNLLFGLGMRVAIKLAAANELL